MRLLKPTISVPRAIAESWSRKGSGGSGLSLRFDDLNSVGEPYTENYFRQLVVAIEATPAFLGGLGQLEDHGARSCSRGILWSALFGGGPSRMSFRWGWSFADASSAHPAWSRPSESPGPHAWPSIAGSWAACSGHWRSCPPNSAGRVSSATPRPPARSRGRRRRPRARVPSQAPAV